MVSPPLSEVAGARLLMTGFCRLLLLVVVGIAFAEALLLLSIVSVSIGHVPIDGFTVPPFTVVAEVFGRVLGGQGKA